MFRNLYNKVWEFITSTLQFFSISKSPSKPPIMFNDPTSSSKSAHCVLANNVVKFRQIRESHPCFLEKVVWHKITSPPYHEFLVFYASKDEEKVVGLVERRVNYTEQRPPMKVIVQKDLKVRPAGANERPGPGDIQSSKDLEGHLAEADIDAINAELIQAEAERSLHTPPTPPSSPPEDGSDRPKRHVASLTQGMSSVSSSNSGSISSSLRSDLEADDQFLFSYKGNDKFIDHYEGTHKEMHVLPIPRGRFTVAALCVLARVVHKYRPKYTLLEYQCYWFARTIFQTIEATVGIEAQPTGNIAKTFDCGCFSGLPTPPYMQSDKIVESNRQRYIDMFNEAWVVELAKLEEEREARELPERLRRAAEEQRDLAEEQRDQAEEQRDQAEAKTALEAKERKRAERERERAERERDQADQARELAEARAERAEREIAVLRRQSRPQA